ncbi:MAG: acyl-CoA dehydrogenase family protein, partial [Candidatus Microthrix sp.]|nr:acyl-CoA dehydrogenase family protein [Candidatus Microthrix sp.]
KMATGEVVTAIAMTEPGTGSGFQAIRTTAIKDGDEYVINGSKTFITNGFLWDLVVVVAKTDPAGGRQGHLPCCWSRPTAMALSGAAT